MVLGSHEKDDLDGLCSRVPVGGRVQRLAPPVDREHPGVHHDLEPLVRLIAVGTTRERFVGD